MKWIPVAGTSARKRHDHARSWYRVGSPLDHLLVELGYQRVEQDGDPTTPDKGFWSGDINGLMLQRAFLWRDKHPAWKTGGETLRSFLLSRRAEFVDGVTLILHSHAGQVGAYALDGLTVTFQVHVITCDMPVRADMQDVYARAATRVASWTHLYSEKGWRSYMRWLGDGQLFSNPRVLPVATRNIEMKGWHSGCLSDPRFIGQWTQFLTHGVTGGRPSGPPSPNA